MHILFLHNNHPAQFKYLIPALIEAEHKVLFLSSFPGSSNPKIKQVWAKNPTENPSEATEYFRSSLEKLSAKYTFDLIISHSGFCCGLFAKYYFPRTPLISYLEWWFSNEPSQIITPTPFINYLSSTYSKLYLRNRSTALELSVADAIVSPTDWQCKFLPEAFKQRLNIIFDGVPKEHNLLKDLQHQKQNYITYASRGLEPIRCFPEFIKSIPYLRSQGCTHKIFILGADKVHYGCGAPSKQIKSFKRWAKLYLEKNNCLQDVFFMGKLKYKSYLTVLKDTTLHIHLTQPFVPSWSLFDSLALGSPTLVSENSSTSELISKSAFAKPTANTFKPERLALDIYDSLQGFSGKVFSSEEKLKINQDFFDLYGIDRCIEKWMDLINSFI